MRPLEDHLEPRPKDIEDVEFDPELAPDDDLEEAFDVYGDAGLVADDLTPART